MGEQDGFRIRLVNPETATGEYPGRESIEIRALVFHPEDTD